ncbi:MAG: MYXO-CTERM sorting domain-containing protein [Planctomycetota bacterium]|jgi:uncharacterized protein (TIGR03382 family)
MISRALHVLSRMSRGLCAVGILAVAPHAHADMMLSMDINSITALWQPGDGAPLAFDTNATGTIVVTEDASSELVDIRVDGIAQAMSSSLDTVFGFIDLVAGSVVSGRLGVTMLDGSTYIASIDNTEGKVNTQAGQGFTTDGLTFSGAFSNLVGGNLFAGVDVSNYSGTDLLGSFLLHAFSPDAFGIDDDTDLEIYVQPIPSPGALALMGLGGLALARRRRA